jgi:hypothetical protein
VTRPSSETAAHLRRHAIALLLPPALLALGLTCLITTAALGG